MSFLNLNHEEFKRLKTIVNSFKLDFIFNYDDNYKFELSEIYDYLLFFCILYCHNNKNYLADEVLRKIKFFLNIDKDVDKDVNILKFKERELLPITINFNEKELKIFIQMLNNYGFSLITKKSNIMVFDKIVIDFFRELSGDYIMISGSFDSDDNITEIGNIIECFIDKFFIGD